MLIHLCVLTHGCVPTSRNTDLTSKHKDWEEREEASQAPLNAFQHHQALLSTSNFHIISYYIKAILPQVP